MSSLFMTPHPSFVRVELVTSTRVFVERLRPPEPGIPSVLTTQPTLGAYRQFAELLLIHSPSWVSGGPSLIPAGSQVVEVQQTLRLRTVE